MCDLEETGDAWLVPIQLDEGILPSAGYLCPEDIHQNGREQDATVTVNTRRRSRDSFLSFINDLDDRLATDDRNYSCNNKPFMQEERNHGNTEQPSVLGSLTSTRYDVRSPVLPSSIPAALCYSRRVDHT